jgi:hypothetical protein
VINRNQAAVDTWTKHKGVKKKNKVIFQIYVVLILILTLTRLTEGQPSIPAKPTPSASMPKPQSTASVPKPTLPIPKPTVPGPKPTAPARKPVAPLPVPKATAKPVMKPSKKPSAQPSQRPSIKLFIPPFLLNNKPLPVYPFVNGVCNNQNANIRPPIPEIEQRRDAIKRVYLKYTPSGDYDAKQSYNYMVTSQPGGATYINRMVNLMYTEAALNGYNLTMIYYANAAARFVHNGTTYLYPNVKLSGAPQAFIGWLFLDMFARFHCLMEDDFKDQVRQMYQNWPYNAPYWKTANLSMLRSHIGYLAGILWPQMNFSATNTFPFSRFVSDVTYHARKHAYFPPWETFSDVYGYYNLFPSVSVAHFANETALASTADIGVQMALARYASVWQLGRLNAQCGRCESNDIHNFNQWGFRAELWTLYGDKDINMFLESPRQRNSLLWFSAAVNYELDSDILSIASQKKTGRVSLIGPGSYTFMSDSFLSKSYALYRCGTPALQYSYVPKQSTLPGIQWNGYDSSYNATRSNMYVGVFENCFLAVPCSQWNAYVQQWMLHKNTLLLVVDNKRNDSMYDVNKKPTAIIVAGSFPSSKQYPDQVYNFSCANVTCNGAYRLFYAYGNNSVLIAVTSNQPFYLQSKLVNITPVVSTIFNDRSWYTNLSAAIPEIDHFGAAGFAMEAADPNDYTGKTLHEKLRDFANKIVMKTSFEWKEPSSNIIRSQLTYTDLEGNILYKQFMDNENKRILTQHWLNQSALESVNGVVPPAFQYQNIHESPLVFQSYYQCSKGMNFAQYSFLNYMPCPFWIRPSTIAPWRELKNPLLTWTDSWARLEQLFGPICTCVLPPSAVPSRTPSVMPSVKPTKMPSLTPSKKPSTKPSKNPSAKPSSKPSRKPSKEPSTRPSSKPSMKPSKKPSVTPSKKPSTMPTVKPSVSPSTQPSTIPSIIPSERPSKKPFTIPSESPSNIPTKMPRKKPSSKPSSKPSKLPTKWPSKLPSRKPNHKQTLKPSMKPLAGPSKKPSHQPSEKPKKLPTNSSSLSLYVPPFVINTKPFPVYPFVIGVCNNQKANTRSLIPEVEQRRNATKRVYLKYTSTGEYDAKLTYTYMVTSQPGGAICMNRMVNLMYTEAALNGYNLTMIFYANAAARFVHDGASNKNANTKLSGPPQAYTGWLFIDMFLRFNCLMEDDFKDEIRKFYQVWPYNSPSWSYSNLPMLRSHIGYLAGILWPQMNFSASNMLPYSRFLSDVILIARKNAYEAPWETFSDSFGTWNLFPSVSVAHFSNDTSLALIADVGVQMALARYASVWQLGRLNSQCALCGTNDIHNYHQWGFRAELWTLFGDSDINLILEPDSEKNLLLGFSAAVNYHLDPVISAIASQKKDGRVSLVIPGQATLFFDSYLQKSYALYRNGIPAMQFGSIPSQSTFPGIQWNGYNSSYNASRSNIYAGVFTDCFLTTGCGQWNPYVQQWMLHKNTLLLVVDNKRNSTMYDLYKKPTAIIVTGSFPSSTQYVDQVFNFSCANVLCNGSYRLFYGYGNNSILIAVTSNQPFRLQPKLINVNAAVYTNIFNDRSWYTNLSTPIPEIQHFGAAAFAMEAANPVDYAGFTLQQKLQTFAATIISRTSFLWQEPSSNVTRARLTYKDLEGNIIYKQWMDEENKRDPTQHWLNQSALESVNAVVPTIFQYQNIHESPLVFQSYYKCTKGMNFAQYSYGLYMPCPFWIRPNVTSPWKELKNPQLTWYHTWTTLQYYYGPKCSCDLPP